MSEKSIKELSEALSAVEVLAISGIAIAKDGIGMDDLPKALELIKQHEKLIAGFSGLSEIPEEVKDLSQEELMELGLKVFTIVKNIQAATK